jgi:hypothetical protein
LTSDCTSQASGSALLITCFFPPNFSSLLYATLCSCSIWVTTRLLAFVSPTQLVQMCHFHMLPPLCHDLDANLQQSSEATRVAVSVSKSSTMVTVATWGRYLYPQVSFSDHDRSAIPYSSSECANLSWPRIVCQSWVFHLWRNINKIVGATVEDMGQSKTSNGVLQSTVEVCVSSSLPVCYSPAL